MLPQHCTWVKIPISVDAFKTYIFLGRRIRIFGTNHIGTNRPFFEEWGGEGSEERDCLVIGHYTDQHYVSLERSPPISLLHPVPSSPPPPPPPPDSSSPPCPALPSSPQNSPVPISLHHTPSSQSPLSVPRCSTPQGTPTTTPSGLVINSPLSQTNATGKH